jgi:hypothetical protein
MFICAPRAPPEWWFCTPLLETACCKAAISKAHAIDHKKVRNLMFDLIITLETSANLCMKLLCIYKMKKEKRKKLERTDR